MKLKKIVIHRLPGFTYRGFTLNDLSEELNIIVGPNGSGKSSICRAIQRLLWPELHSGFNPCEIETVWQVKEADSRGISNLFTLSLEGGKRNVGPTGKDLIAELPSASWAESYLLTIDSLFDGEDRFLAQKILQQLSGGYDLDGALNKVMPSKATRGAVLEWKEAEVKYKEYIRKTKRAPELEAQLQELQKAITQGKQRQKRALRVEAMIKSKQLLTKIEAIEAQLGSFSKPIRDGCVQQGDWHSLQQLNLQIEEWQTDLNSVEEKVKAVRQRLSGFQPKQEENETIFERGLQEQKKRIRLLLHLHEKRQDQLIPAIREAEASLTVYLNFWGLKKEELGQLNGRLLSEITEKLFVYELRVSELGRLWAQMQMAQVQMPSLAQSPNDEGEKSQEGVKIQEVCTTNRLCLIAEQFFLEKYLPPLIYFPLTLLFVFLLLLITYSEKTATYALALASFSLFAFCLYPFILAVVKSNTLKKQFDFAQNLCLAEQLQQQANYFLKEELKQLQQTHQNQAEEQYKRLEEELLERRKELALELSALGLKELPSNQRMFFEQIKELIDAHADLQQLQAQLCLIDTKMEGEWNLWLPFARQMNIDDLPIEQLENSLDSLNKNFLLTKQLRELQETQQTLHDKLAITINKKTELLERTECIQNPLGLQELINGLQLYQKLLYQKERLIEEFQEILVNNNLTIEEIKRCLVEDLIEEKEQLKHHTEELELLISKEGQLSNQLETMVQSEQGQTLQQQLLEKLTNVEDAAEAFVSRRLLMHIASCAQQEYERLWQPKVVKTAAEWFSRITGQQWRLITHPNKSGQLHFEAVETSTMQQHPLHTLSRGTRIQLLIAVRLAFAMTQTAENLKLPLFFDEPLAHSDSLRSHAICCLLKELAEEGRQLFFTTCDPMTAEQLLEQWPTAKLFDLAALQQSQTYERQQHRPKPTIVPKLPEPEKDCAKSYAAQLQLPTLCLDEPLQMCSIHYVTDKAQQIKQLIQAGVRTVGQWQTLAEQWQNKVFAKEAQTMRRRAALLAHFYELKKQGRSKPLEKQMLIEAGMGTNRVEALWSLAVELECKPKPFLNALEHKTDERTKGTLKKKITEVRQLLIEQGILDERDEMTDDEIRQKMLPYIECEEERLFIEELLLV